MILYLITKSEWYYPTGGAGDWKHVTANRTEAQRLFEDEELGHYQTIHLIQVSAKGWIELGHREL